MSLAALCHTICHILVLFRAVVVLYYGIYRNAQNPSPDQRRLPLTANESVDEL
uniref:Uncharacterized protein n=1 Tax=Anopheles arabiensis TaxID=7173 RepID=A0A182IHQ5_ANOAR